MHDPFCPVEIDAVPAKIEMDELTSGSETCAGPFRVRAVEVFHPAPALAYRIEADGRSLVYATDTEDPFSGKDDPVIELARGADMLIHDAQYLDDDYKKGWGHSTVSTAIDVGLRAGVKRIVLYHHDPVSVVPVVEGVGEESLPLFPDVVGAVEGVEVSLPEVELVRTFKVSAASRSSLRRAKKTRRSSCLSPTYSSACRGHRRARWNGRFPPVLKNCSTR